MKTSPSNSRQNPIAIIGIGCRFPGQVDSPEKLWHLISKKKDAITSIPPDRWDADKLYDPEPGTPGKYYTRAGGFIQDIHSFDFDFFGISPREASRMDPHQKILLEVSWEAFEDAGVQIDRGKRMDCGVFVGISNQDWQKVNTSLFELDNITPHTATGVSFSIAANRISHNLNLAGPSIALDTACSSSLVAIHLACQSLYNNECSLALAGGANVILSPDSYVSFSALNMLSPDGRCRAFDARANGFVRSEGSGMVVLKPLRQALNDRDRIYAVILGTGSNQDARTPGITVPSLKAQAQLIEHIYQEVGIDPAEVGYVEAHGTGTAVGDPIEAQAIGTVVGRHHSQQNPCYIGSLKSNIGHLEPAAGVAGLIKAALALYKHKIPPNLHFEKPNPKIAFEKWHLKVPRKLTAWPHNSGRLAAVNSFGFGGTNAHVVLEAASPVQLQQISSDSPDAELFCLTAHSQQALENKARQYISQSSPGIKDPQNLHDLCGAYLTCRTQHEYRICATAVERSDIHKALEAYLEGRSVPGLASGRIRSQSPHKIAFVFSGQGPQWWAMGRELMKSEPVYRQAIEECHSLLSGYADWSLLEELNAEEKSSRLHLTSIAQPAIFALQVGLLKLWRSWGIKPNAAVGHSVGEVAAAYAGGILSLEDALFVIYHRGRSMENAASSAGRMLAVGLSPDEAGKYIKSHEGRVHLGAVNSPVSVTLTGDAAPLEEIEKILQQDDVFCRFIKTHYAFHSHHMEGMKDILLETLKDIQTHKAKIPVYSTVTGKLAEQGDFGTEYWWANVRQQVKFAAAIEALIQQDFSVFLELGPHPVLAAPMTESLIQHQRQAVILPSLKRKKPERFALLSTLGSLYTQGVPVNWKAIYTESYQHVRLPLHHWNREKSWYQSDLHQKLLLENKSFPLLGTPLNLPNLTWESSINGWMLPFLNHHCIHGQIILPGTAYLEIALDLYRSQGKAGFPILENMQLYKAAFLTSKKNLLVRTTYDPEEMTYHIHCKDESRETKWHLHASGTLLPTQKQKKRKLSLSEIRRRLSHSLSKEQCYRKFLRSGIKYGPDFQGVEEIYRGRGEILAKIRIPAQLRPDLQKHMFHPAILDACFQPVIAAPDLKRELTYLPVALQRFSMFALPTPSMWSHITYTKSGANKLRMNVNIMDQHGSLIAEAHDVSLQGVRHVTHVPETDVDDMLYRYEWIPAPLEKAASSMLGDKSTPARTWMIFDDSSHMGKKMAAWLHTQGQRCLRISAGSRFQQLEEGHYSLPLNSKAALKRLLKTSEFADSSFVPGAILDFTALDIQESEAIGPRKLHSLVSSSSIRLLNLVQEILAWRSNDPPRLWIVTRGAETLEGTSIPGSPFQASICGLSRVIVNELPQLDCTLIDLDPTESSDEAMLEAIQHEIIAESPEDEIAYRAGIRYIPRLRKTRLYCELDPTGRRDAEGSANYRLELSRPGVIENLIIRQAERKSPTRREVEIQVHSAGLNFSDVLKTLNLYPGLPEGEIPLGIECAGIVTAVGQEIRTFRPGDRVMAVVPSSISAYVTVSEEYLVPVPSGMSLADAATLPLAFLTAHYAMVYLGRLQPGERVLIHSASGGVGLAAIQIARGIGAEIIATAGTPKKRAYLKSLGIPEVYDSRSLEFAHEIQQTSGQGVDMILNSLAGEAINKGLSLLKEHGRFLEIGKRDIYSNKRIGLFPFRNNLVFHSIDLDKILRTRPGLIRELLQDISALIASGDYRALPKKVFAISRAQHVFRTMAQAQHIGKLVLKIQEKNIRTFPTGSTSISFKSEASYLITGAYGGFGLVVADWMANHGARHLILMGRHGATSQTAVKTLDRLKKRGIRITEYLGNVALEQDVRGLFTKIADLPPLRGIIHCAMVLDDAMLLNLDETRMFNVMDPKIKGAWNLHALSQNFPLDFFVLFSSVSSLIGMPGQGNYVAANAFLDNLTLYRRAQGLPSMTINWGYLGKVGIAARSPAIAARFEKQGLKSFSPEQAMELMSRFLLYNVSQIAVINMDWSRFVEVFQSYAVSPKFSELWNDTDEEQPGADPSASAGTSLRKRMLIASDKDKLEILQTALLDQVAKVLGTTSKKINTGRPLTELGFDSLMAVELRNWLENNLGVVLPTMEVMRGPSLEQLSNKLLNTFMHTHATPSRNKDQTGQKQQEIDILKTSQVLPLDSDSVDKLSDQEVDELLASLLKDNG